MGSCTTKLVSAAKVAPVPRNLLTGSGDTAINHGLKSFESEQPQVNTVVCKHRGLSIACVIPPERWVETFTLGLDPLMNSNQVENFTKQVQQAIDEGAKPVLRGKVDGNVVSPTVLADVHSNMRIAKTEVFGPAVSLMPFGTPEDAVRLANDSAFGLSGAIHTGNAEWGAELAKQIDSGMVHVNDATINDEPLVAFGGEKASGIGRLNGQWALETNSPHGNGYPTAHGETLSV